MRGAAKVSPDETNVKKQILIIGILPHCYLLGKQHDECSLVTGLRGGIDIVVIVQKFETAADFWNGMVIPDYNEAVSRPEDLRLAFHSASSLNHMCDWVYHTHKDAKDNLHYLDLNGGSHQVSSAVGLATSLELNVTTDIALVRGIANAAKHLKLDRFRPVPNYPSESANVYSSSTGGSLPGTAPLGGGSLNSAQTQTVVLEASGGDVNFESIRDSVYQTWEKLKYKNGW